MRPSICRCVLACAFLATSALAAEPVRDDLLAAWEAQFESLPETTAFEKLEEGRYRLSDSSLPYDGALEVVGSVIRRSDVLSANFPVTHTGFVEFRLTDLPAERLQTQSYYYWAADRQSLYFSEETESWISPADYQSLLNDAYSRPANAGGGFLFDYGLWLVLIVVLIFGIVVIGRHSRKARALMDDAGDINRQARENIERSAVLQKEIVELSRRSIDLHGETNVLLQEIRDEISRR